MKSYTDIEQSKKLAKILPLESADMGWNVFVDDTKRPLPIDDWDLVKDGSGNVKFYPAWSLAALLEILPNDTIYRPMLYKGPHNNLWRGRNNWFDNPLDAVFEMIIKLHEQKLL